MSEVTKCPECGHLAIPIGMLPNKGTELFWICSTCDHRWHYFSPVDSEYARAEYFIKNPKYPLVGAEYP